MKLSEAILKGCEMTPKQAFWDYGEPGNATCAIGAAAEALGLDVSNIDGVEEGLFKRYRKLRASAQWDEIVYRNDVLRQSREEIAAWLAGDGL